MEEKGNKKNFVIGALLVAIVAMAVGYAALSATLTVNGTATIPNTTKFDVKFTAVTMAKATGVTENHSTVVAEPTGSAGFSFGATFAQPGDQIVYTLTMTNTGSIAAQIKGFTVNGVAAPNLAWSNAASDTITYSVVYSDESAIAVGNQIAAGATRTIKVTATWPAETNIPEFNGTDPYTRDMAFTIEFQQA